VREARRALTALALRAGIEEPVLDDVKLAVTEAVSNAVRHGYRGGTRGEITLVAEADDHRLDVTVRDRGYGMAPHVEGHGAGLGLPLISELSETVAVGPNPDGAGTEVRMRFRLPTAVAA
jgi:anti-sigma regulatory factor (Ser/Thr protein kinase)